jgi:hypothetical protein
MRAEQIVLLGTGRPQTNIRLGRGVSLSEDDNAKIQDQITCRALMV